MAQPRLLLTAWLSHPKQSYLRMTVLGVTRLIVVSTSIRQLPAIRLQYYIRMLSLAELKWAYAATITSISKYQPMVVPGSTLSRLRIVLVLSIFHSMSLLLRMVD